MRLIGRISRRKLEFLCKFPVTRTLASFCPGPGWLGESTGSLLTASAGSGSCKCTLPVARERGGRRCASDRVRKLCCSNLNRNSEALTSKNRPKRPLTAEETKQKF